jgi:hypothetical protein
MPEEVTRILPLSWGFWKGCVCAAVPAQYTYPPLSPVCLNLKYAMQPSCITKIVLRGC